jgi:hypothetical protein
LDLIAFSQFRAASLPLACSIEVTIGQKSVSPGASSSLPLYFGSAIHHRLGHLRRRDLVGVVDHHAEAARHPEPVAVGRAVGGGDVGERRGVDLRQQPAIVELLEPVGVLGVEDVGGRAAALLLDLRGEHRLVV